MKSFSKWLLISVLLPLVMIVPTRCDLLGLSDDDSEDNSALLLGIVALVLSSGCSGDVINSTYFRTLRSATTSSCTLTDGTVTTCCQLTFQSNPSTIDNETGPFCPATTAQPGGYGNYDGATGAGFQRMNATLFNNMEADGYDILNATTVRTLDPRTGTGDNSTGAACLDASADDNLSLTFTIPLTQSILAAPDTLSSVELLGVSLDGIPINSTPPSVVANNGKIPSLDLCGGHHDPSGYWHWHFIPDSVNVALAAMGFGSTCTVFTQNASALVGFAKDGYPIYAYQDSDGTTPTGLDSCNGHTGNTTHFGEKYHYHAKNGTQVNAATAPINLPDCVIGASVDRNFTAR
jgi:hypothetical protein